MREFHFRSSLLSCLVVVVVGALFPILAFGLNATDPLVISTAQTYDTDRNGLLSEAEIYAADDAWNDDPGFGGTNDQNLQDDLIDFLWDLFQDKVQFGSSASSTSQIASPTPPVVPGGNSNNSSNPLTYETVVTKIGMRRRPRGVAPFGKDIYGNPKWPVPDPGTDGVARSGGSQSGGGANPGPGGKLQDALLEINKKKTDRRISLSDLKKPASAESGEAKNPETASSALRQDTLLSASLIEVYKRNFLVDSQRHAQAVYGGDEVKAYWISTRWRHLAGYFPRQIEEMTWETSRRNRLSSFREFITRIQKQDRQAVLGNP